MQIDPFHILGLPPLVVILLAAAVVMVAISLGPPRRQQRQRRLAARSVACRACGAVLPPFAKFCSRCGRRL